MAELLTIVIYIGMHLVTDPVGGAQIAAHLAVDGSQQVTGLGHVQVCCIDGPVGMPINTAGAFIIIQTIEYDCIILQYHDGSITTLHSLYKKIFLQ